MAHSSGSQKKSMGGLLKETREAKGISLSTIHEVTKIPMDVLKAIEEGYTVHSLSSFYLKGFIKMYAQYLDVEMKPEMFDQKVDEEKETHVERKPPVQVAVKPDDQFDSFFNKERQRWIVLIIGAVLLFVLCLRVGGCILAKARAAKSSVKTSTVVDVPPSADAIPVPKPKAQKATSVPTAQNTAAVPEVKTIAVTPVAAQKVKEPEAAPQAIDPEPPENKVRVTIRARKKGWLQVKVDGMLVLQSTIREGAVESWTAEKQIEVSGRIIHELEFELNGKVLGALGRADRTARRVIITKDGLSVKE